MQILVTGGAGYIGSHTIIELIKNNHSVVVVDNIANSNAESIRRIEKIVNQPITFYKADLRDKSMLQEIFDKHTIDAVIHIAGLKAVGESVDKPLVYYRTNIDSALTLLETMQEYNVKKLVFSSSATVYGSAPFPYTESHAIGQGITNPYGRTKYFIEEILNDVAKTDETLEFTALRYFNPIGAHESGLIGEDPKGVPNNIMPYISQVASGRREKLSVFGNDYDTPDGTCIRDYIHVMDVAKGHVAALMGLSTGYHAYNLGSGKGTSVLELIHAFESATGRGIPYEIAPRREGDLDEFYADASKAKRELGWQVEKTIEDACRDSWNWQSTNPNGYEN